MKKFIRKVAAVGAGSAMLLGTLGGALATDATLADLPEPFVVGEAYADVAMVVGSAAGTNGTNDNAARSALKTYFDGEATATAGDVALDSDAYDREFYFEVNFNDTTAFGSAVDDEKVSTLLDSKVDWGDKSYDVREIINFTDGAEISTSVNSTGIKEFGGEPYITFEGGAVSYVLNFDDLFNESDSSTQNLSSTTPLEVDILGKTIKISDVSVTTADTVTLTIADDYTFKEGESQTVDGSTVTVGSIFDGSVEVTMDGVTKIISLSSSHDFGDLTVKVDTIGYNSNNPDLSKAILNVGSKVTDTVTDGEAFELFTDYDPDNDAPWEWQIDTKGTAASGGSLYQIGVTLRLPADDLDVSDSDPNPDPVGVGETFSFPNDYIGISFDETTDTSYCTITITANEEFDVNTSATGTSNGKDAKALIFDGDENNCFAVGGVDTDTVYALHGAGGANSRAANASWDLWYNNNEGIKTNSTSTTFNIDWDDTIMTVAYANQTADSAAAAQYVNITKDTNAATADQNIWLNTTGGFDHFGTTGDFDSGKNEVTYSQYWTTATPFLDLSGRDYQAITMYGLVLGDDGSNIEDDLDSDKVVIKVPNNRAQAIVSIGAGSQVTGGATVEPALVNDAGAAGYDNLILVGGPCVNELTAEYMGLTFPACEGDSGILENKAIVQLVEMGGKTALIVAGWEAADTKRAADTVAAGGLTGTDLIVE